MSKLKAVRKKPEQAPSLVHCPTDGPGTIANEYVDLLQEIDNRKKSLADCGMALIDALKAAKRSEILVRGLRLKVKEIEAKISLVVKRPKEE